MEPLAVGGMGVLTRWHRWSTRKGLKGSRWESGAEPPL